MVAGGAGARLGHLGCGDGQHAGHLLVERFAAQRVPQPLLLHHQPGAQLLDPAWGPYRPALVAEPALDLAGDGRGGVRGEPGPDSRPVAAHGLDQRRAGHLHQVLGLDAAPVVAQGDRVGQREGGQHQPLGQRGTLGVVVGAGQLVGQCVDGLVEVAASAAVVGGDHGSGGVGHVPSCQEEGGATVGPVPKGVTPRGRSDGSNGPGRTGVSRPSFLRRPAPRLRVRLTVRIRGRPGENDPRAKGWRWSRRGRRWPREGARSRRPETSGAPPSPPSPRPGRPARSVPVKHPP